MNELQKLDLNNIMMKCLSSGIFSYKEFDDIGEVLLMEGIIGKSKFKAFCRGNGNFVAKVTHEKSKRKKFSLVTNKCPVAKKDESFFNSFIRFIE
jgi:hypothetical protein